MDNRYVGLPTNGKSVYLYEKINGKKDRQVLWGDYLHVIGEPQPGWLEINWSPNHEAETLFIRKVETSETRPLEIVFVDVGQGDGAVLISPEDEQTERVLVIDAGENDNMSRFLTQRFGSYQTGHDFHAAVITHADKDHYAGFEPIFEATDDNGDHLMGFDIVYHNGLVERADGSGYERIGIVTQANGRDYLTGFPKDKADIRALFDPVPATTQKPFARLIKAALANDRIKAFRILSTGHGTAVGSRRFIPDFGPGDGRPYTLEVLGPIIERINGNTPALRKISSYAKTKNGHSVILKLAIGEFTILFGGDLNEEAERFLLRYHSGLARFPRPGTPAHTEMVETAAGIYGADVMKVCHHGSEKVTDEFLTAVHPAVFVISSGDEEGHVHPRPDLLGRLGKVGRGSSPVLLSTELQRSTRADEDPEVLQALHTRIERLGQLQNPPSATAIDTLKEKVDELGRTNVGIFGSIYVKTDGERLIAAFKIESGSNTKKWFYFEYAFDANGELVLV